jgi:AcrR family transcriptional regulator
MAVGTSPEDSAEDIPPSARRTGRRQGDSGTRQGIIRSAQKLFAERGYRGATMRAIARDARVDAALIHHFFGSKEGVFAAAVGEAFQPEEILREMSAPSPDTVGERLIRSFLSLCDTLETRAPVLAVVTSAVTDDDAAGLVRNFVTRQVIGHVVEANATADKELRSALIGAEIIGMLIVRYVISIEPLASMAAEAVSRLLGPVVDRFLADDLTSRLSAGPGREAAGQAREVGPLGA